MLYKIKLYKIIFYNLIITKKNIPTHIMEIEPQTEPQIEPIIDPQPYECKICFYKTFVKKNLLWHNSLESHLSRARYIKPTALSIFQEIKKLSNEERVNLLKYINEYDFMNCITLIKIEY